MITHLSRFLRLSALTMTAVAVGCATTSTTSTDGTRTAKSRHPKTEVTIHSAESVESAAEDPRSAAELLREAEHAFQTANAAQERGDYEAALRHYNKMLELLVKADLDPSIFYNLRGEFERILNGSDTKHARLFDPNDPDWTKKIVPPQSSELPPATVPGELKMPEALAQRVQAEIREIQEVYPRNFQYGLNRSGKYLPYITAEFRKAQLPEDLVWLAMVESQFTPKINSPAGAGGMWQFMRSTGSRYGLRIDNYVDERYNWEKATKAAIAYLTDLGARFDGEWPLAVSAYNMGEGGMERAVAMNSGTRDLVDLIERPPASNVLKMETKKFYPKLLASIIVAKNPEKYGFKYEPQAPDDYVRIPVRGCYSLAALDSASGLPEGTLRQLNPDLIRGVTPPTGEHMLAVPTSAQDRFLTALANVPQEKHQRSIFSSGSESSREAKAPARSTSGGTTHTVKRGETLSSIADKYGVSLEELAKVNHMRTSHRLVSGRKLTIPGTAAKVEQTSKASEPEAKSAPKAEAAKASAEPRTYKVRRGDTLTEIAKREGCSIDDLAKWNGLKPNSGLQAGQSLKLYNPGTSAAPASAATSAPAGDKVEHVVKAGDTPAKIASHYGVSVNDLMKWNNLKNGTIYKDQKLTVYCSKPASSAPAASAKAAPTEAKSSTHKVASGETASSIAAKYKVSVSDLLAWNNLKPTSVLRPGQELVIKGSSASQSSSTSVAKAETKSAPAAKQTVHVVKKGDTPGGIAEKYGVKLSELRAWNGWGKNHTLQIGEKVTIKK